MKLPFVERFSINTATGMPIPHMHPFYEIYLLTEGERTIYIENDKSPMKKNQLVCIPPKTLHRMTGTAYTRYLVNFSPDALSPSEAALISILEKHIISLSLKETEVILSTIDTLQKAQDNHEKDFLAEKQTTLNTCLSYLIIFLSQLTNFPTKKYRSPNDYPLRVRELLAYIHEHYAEKISLNELAEKFYVSKSTLCHEFKKYTNMSITDYILNHRLIQAQELLIYTRPKNLNEIAQLCGFGSAKYLGLIFKQKMGVSPAEFRKTNKNRQPKKV